MIFQWFLLGKIPVQAKVDFERIRTNTEGAEHFGRPKEVVTPKKLRVDDPKKWFAKIKQTIRVGM